MRQAVVFDLDGTLIDSESVSYNVWLEAFGSYGHVITPQIFGRFVGLRTPECLEIAREYFDIQFDEADFTATATAAWHRHVAQGVPLMPGVHALLTALADRNVPWGISTASDRQHAKDALAFHGLSDVCVAYTGADEVAASKPAPDVFLKTAERMGVDPTQCLAVEDSAPGCMAAAAAGMHVVLVPHAFTADKARDFCAAEFASLDEVAQALDTLLV